MLALKVLFLFCTLFFSIPTVAKIHYEQEVTILAFAYVAASWTGLITVFFLI